MENEEKIGMIDENAFEDQFIEFCQFSFGALIFYSLSHTLGHLEYSWGTLGGVRHTWDFEQEGKERQESARGHRDQQLQQNFSQLSSFLYDFLSSYGMHGICMWQFGYDLSLAQRNAWIDGVFSQAFHFLDSHGVVGSNIVFQLVLIFLWFWVELLVLGALVGKMFWSPVIGWVELLVVEP